MPPAKRKSQQRTKEKDLPRGQKRAKTDHTLRKNEYKGWVPSQPGDDEVVRRAFAELQPSILWMKYVRPRRPVVLTGGLNDPELAAVRGWTLDYMSKKAGEAMVSVEKRDGPQDTYGKGHRVRMPFKQLAEALQSGDKNLYLTTQEAAGHEAEHAPLAASPVSDLLDDIPVPPSIMGSLVPQTINLWLGSSAEGASSGLHHDYHDNLYVLVKGKKAFHLWSPADAHSLYTHGKIARVHANGRIVYNGEGEVLADGSRPEGQKRPANKKSAGQHIAEGAACTDADSDFEETALEAALARFEDGCDSADDYSGSEADGNQEEEEEPPSFSRIDLSRPESEIAASFPKFPGLAAAVTCTLHAGDMLYLPAGWFHNVTSSNEGPGQTPAKKGGRYHLALNYWFHPPDNLDALTGFKRPYTTDFWPKLWAARAHGQQ